MLLDSSTRTISNTIFCNNSVYTNTNTSQLLLAYMLALLCLVPVDKGDRWLAGTVVTPAQTATFTSRWSAQLFRDDALTTRSHRNFRDQRTSGVGDETKSLADLIQRLHESMLERRPDLAEQGRISRVRLKAPRFLHVVLIVNRHSLFLFFYI